MSGPDVSDALWDLTDSLQFAVVGKSVQDHQVVEANATVITFQGAIEPVPAQRLRIKPEGERDWKYWTLRCTSRLQLDWVVADPDGKQYRVTQIADWSRRGGYFEYELTEAVPQ